MGNYEYYFEHIPAVQFVKMLSKSLSFFGERTEKSHVLLVFKRLFTRPSLIDSYCLRGSGDMFHQHMELNITIDKEMRDKGMLKAYAMQCFIGYDSLYNCLDQLKKIRFDKYDLITIHFLNGGAILSSKGKFQESANIILRESNKKNLAILTQQWVDTYNQKLGTLQKGIVVNPSELHKEMVEDLQYDHVILKRSQKDRLIVRTISNRDKTMPCKFICSNLHLMANAVMLKDLSSRMSSMADATILYHDTTNRESVGIITQSVPVGEQLPNQTRIVKITAGGMFPCQNMHPVKKPAKKDDTAKKAETQAS